MTLSTNMPSDPRTLTLAALLWLATLPCAAQTGETLWVYNPRVCEAGNPPLPSPWNHRGVAYWEGGDEALASVAHIALTSIPGNR